MTKPIYTTQPNEIPEFQILFDKFQFHNSNVQFHAHLCQHIGELLKEHYPQETKDQDYFTDDFFNTPNESLNSK